MEKDHFLVLFGIGLSLMIFAVTLYFRAGLNPFS